MNNIYDILKQHKKEGTQSDFNKALEALLPELKKYVKHNLRILELKGKLPKNYYSADDIIGDIYIRIFNEFNQISHQKDLKIKLFKIANELIQTYVEKENKIKDKLPVNRLLQDELKQLQEKITIDAEGELVLVSDLKDEDISYQQDDFKPKIYIFDKETQANFAQSLGLDSDDFKDEQFRGIFGSLYAQLPETIRRIFDLNALAGLTTGEIAEIMEMDTEKIVQTIVTIKAKLKKS